MKISIFSTFLLSIILLFLSTQTFATKNSYIVYLGSHRHGTQPTSVDIDQVKSSHFDLLGSFIGSTEKAKDVIFYQYTRSINGFAAMLDEEEAAEMAKHPDVVSVFLNKKRNLQTTRSWTFLGLESDQVIPESSIWKKARFGEDTIIGNLDTGVWPESKSFSDEGYGPVPSRWQGTCVKDKTKNPVHCNNKLIGARYFNKGFGASYGKLNSSFNSARDDDGHGSHTLSTAGGNFVHGANIFGYAGGTAKGGSPKARVAAYKVCWPGSVGGCYDVDILAGFDAAISDGVDVISVSLGSNYPVEFFAEGTSIGAFHAVKKGIVVVCAAGNEGPDPGTVKNSSPWVFTVGASTIDREFTNYVGLGNGKHMKGASLSTNNMPQKKFYPLISSGNAKLANVSATDATLCFSNSLDPKKVKGKIVTCLRGINARAAKEKEVARAGGAGIILANDELSGNATIADDHVLPASHIIFTDGEAVFTYINSTKNPMAHITRPRTVVGVKNSPLMASFSSRGPNPIEPVILKPDITAPGVNILAAFAEINADTDKGPTPYKVESGTSMACPHVSGIVGLLKTLNPGWSPAAIKSAVMTTARTRNNIVAPIQDFSYQKATPFAYGAGHVRPNRAMDPGLVYDLTIDDYLIFLCAHGYNEDQIRKFSDKNFTCPKSASLANFNYPSITIPDLKGAITVTRRVKNVGAPGTYYARFKAPKSVSISVNPTSLTFDVIGEEKSFNITLKSEVKGSKPTEYVFGSLVWSDGKHYVRSPIVVKPN
ncbi:subtilisin-like protease SBT5.4 [Tripterygium wilfordii]|uniref:subtilisin-like protease SBT5.4 n=1 Tax=Tripterygium wilfordii TaxID=458696 RepID=UPI0018F81C74|nr:subtilisin-like protease SBT5.4 [Tripterygium wilfordii]